MRYTLILNVNDIKQLNDGSIWIATDAGINTMDSLATGIIRSYQYDFNEWLGISDPVIRKIFQDKEGGVWLTTPLGGVSLYHAADNLFQYYTQKTDGGRSDELLDFSIISMTISKNKKEVWLGTRKGLSSYDPTTDLFTHYPFSNKKNSNQIYSIEVNGESKLWVGTESGLLLFDKRTGQYQPFNQPEFNDKIKKVFTDNEGKLWVGTESRGLYILDLEKPLKQKIESGPGNNPEIYNIKGINDAKIDKIL